MHYPKQITFFLHYKYYPFSFIVWLLFCFSSCKNDAEKDGHPEYFNKVFEKLGKEDVHIKKEDLAYLDSAYNAFPHAGTLDKMRLYNRKRDYYTFVKDYTNALVYLDSILLILGQKLNNQKYAVEYASTLFYRGDTYFEMKNYEEGFHNYFLAKQFVLTKLTNQCELSGYNGRLANVLYKQGKYRLAAGYYMQDYYDRSKCDTVPFTKFVYMQVNLDNAGECYYNAGMLDSASWYFNAALDYIQKEGPVFNAGDFLPLAKAVVYGNQAAVLHKQGHFAAAEKLYRQSIQGTVNSDRGYTQSTQVNLAGMYIENNLLRQADTVLQQLKLSLDTMANEPVQVKWYKLKTVYHAEVNQTNASYSYLQKYLSLRDSIEARDKPFTATDITREFENREQKAANELLKKDNHLKTLYLLVAVITLAMTLAIVLLVWYNLKRSGRHAKQLENLNREINHKNGDLQKTLTSLEQSHNENARIIKIVAHDLKNPISAIHNLVYALLKKGQAGSVKDALELIKTACISSITLINDLLSEKKKLADIRKEIVDMARLLEYCVELLQASADEKNQLIRLDAHPAFIMLNRQKMWQVISNIVNNAIKFSPENTVINIKLEKKDSTVLLSVKDNGIGIPENLKDKIFQLTPEASRAGTSGEESHGLGLSITQKIIEEHNGKIWFESEVGSGSVFYVELPLQKATSQELLASGPIV